MCVHPCVECPKTFANRHCLVQHVRRYHRAKTVECYYCKYKTKWKESLIRHIKSQHLKNKCVEAPRTLPVCSLCKFEASSRKQILEHYSEQHSIDVCENKIEFANWDEFAEWKEGIEQLDVCSFNSCRGQKTTRTAVISRYRCFRDGWYQLKGKGKRHVKMKGSIKINGVCPASVKAEKDRTTGIVRVSYIHSHVGHSEELGRLNLTKKERADIARKLAMNIPYTAIIDEIRESMRNSDLRRLHLTTRKDLWNIEASFRLNKTTKGFLHGNDRVSVEAWVKSMQADSTVVRFYKPQSTVLPSHPDLRVEDMVLIFACDEQIEMLGKYGSDVICFDGTHGLNAYEFELTTLLVLNNERQGFPCAYMFSSRCDSEIMTLFVEVVKDLLPAPLHVNVFMSDMSEIYWKGWSKVMPEPNNHLFCTWHVDHAWRTNLNKIRNMEKRSQVYKTLKTVMTETNEASFLALVNRAMETFDEDPMTKEFGDYFRKTYSQNMEAWAYCYRKEFGINRNLYLENVHKVLKYIYLNGKKTKRLDKTISALLRLSRDKLFDQLIISERGKLTNKVSTIRNRHETSTSMKCAIVPCGDGWLISSQSIHDMYMVQKTNVEGCDCALRCADCNICIHSFKCDCIDSVIKSNICKHIHCVSLFIAKEKRLVNQNSKQMGATVPQPGPSANEGETEELVVCEIEKSPIEDVLMHELSKQECVVSENDLSLKKAKIRAKVEAILEDVRCDEHAEILWNALLPVPPTIQAHSSLLDQEF